jgi:hypothetical protein
MIDIGLEGWFAMPPFYTGMPSNRQRSRQDFTGEIAQPGTNRLTCSPENIHAAIDTKPAMGKEMV